MAYVVGDRGARRSVRVRALSSRYAESCEFLNFPRFSRGGIRVDSGFEKSPGIVEPMAVSEGFGGARHF